MEIQNKICQNCKNQFVIEPADFDFYEKIKVPPPTWCSQCRFQRRLLFMNERALYKRDCDMCKKSIVTMYSPDKNLIVYCNPCWWSDKWDARDYGREYDPSKSFFEQFKELNEKTPQMALAVEYPTLLNSEYMNHGATAKNCYLIYTADECENVLYSEILLQNKDSMDGTMLDESELCYGVINCEKCYKVFFSEDCESSTELYFSKDCNGCSYCFGCIGLRNKKYHIFNEPYTKEEYQKKLQEFKTSSYREVENLKQQAISFWKKFPHKFFHGLRNLNVTGDYVYQSKNSKDMYIVNEGAENCRYCQILTMPPIRDAYDYSIWGNNAQRIYECIIVGESADTIKFSFSVWPNVRNVEYSMFVISSSYMFGCANIRSKKYCILNKQYTEEEYEKLRERIIKDMNEKPFQDANGRTYSYGEFFPPELSLFGYNESYAAEFFPLNREDAKKRGLSWYNPQPNPHKPTIVARNLPDNIDEVTESILQEIIECDVCTKPFRIVQAELPLLRRFGLPIPHKCPNCRYRERLSRVNPPRLYHRICQCAGKQSGNGIYTNTGAHLHSDNNCSNEFETSYAPDRPEIVYCEQCYNSEVV